MFTPLLASALTWAVTFPGGRVVQVPLPEPAPPDLYTRADPVTRFNPTGTAAVVQACAFGPVNADWCELIRVTPRRGSLNLGRQPGLPGLSWTPGGQYLIAWNDSGVRLWTLRGAKRDVTPTLPIQTGERVFGQVITRFWVQGRAICLRVDFAVWDEDALAPSPDWVVPGSAPAPPLKTVRRLLAYRWPRLSPTEEAACRRP